LVLVVDFVSVEAAFSLEPLLLVVLESPEVVLLESLDVLLLDSLEPLS